MKVKRERKMMPNRAEIELALIRQATIKTQIVSIRMLNHKRYTNLGKKVSSRPISSSIDNMELKSALSHSNATLSRTGEDRVSLSVVNFKSVHYTNQLLYLNNMSADDVDQVEEEHLTYCWKIS